MEHEIRMRAPQFVLSGPDVLFDVFIDKKKRGELLVSKGNLRWRPRSSKRKVFETSWENFAA